MIVLLLLKVVILSMNLLKTLFLLLTFIFAFGPVEASELFEKEAKTEVFYQYNKKNEVGEPSINIPPKKALQFSSATFHISKFSALRHTKARLHLLYCCLLR
jgi:hypothetical protein